MSLTEGVSQTIVYKPYSTGNITANSQPLIALDPMPGEGKTLRRVSSTINLEKNVYQSNEIRADRQIADYRHGTRRVSGKIAGELSPSSYFDFFEAVHRDTKVPALTLLPAAYTSLAMSSAAGTIQFGSGDPVALGLFVGDVIRLTGQTNLLNNAQDFTIVSFGGTNNETISVLPAPFDQAANTAGSLIRPGCTTIVPLTNQIRRKFAFEVFGSDIDVSRVFKEVRLGGYTLTLPASGMSTCDFDVMGRDMDVLSSTSTPNIAPFFNAPSPATTTGVCASVNGLLLVNGISQGVVTAVSMTMNLTPTAADVVGQNFAAEIFLGRADLKGSLTAYFQDPVILGQFLNESEISLLLTLDATSTLASDAVSVFLPRIKLGGASVNLTGEGGQMLTAPFQALLYSGTTPGVAHTTVRIHDTAAS